MLSYLGGGGGGGCPPRLPIVPAVTTVLGFLSGGGGGGAPLPPRADPLPTALGAGGGGRPLILCGCELCSALFEEGGC